MQLTTLHRRILVAVLRERDSLLALAPDWRVTDPHVRMKIADARSGFVRLDPWAYLGHAPDAASRRRLSRAYAKLEAIGMVTRGSQYGSQRTTMLALSAQGQRVARALAGNAAPHVEST